MKLSVIIPTHNPNEQRLQCTLDGLRAQTISASQWELIIVDNASSPAVSLPAQGLLSGVVVRIIYESKLGLTSARKAGLRVAKGELIVFVDDDNVLASDYLELTLAAFSRLPRVGALGGKSQPSFETKPPAWANEFFPLLALRDLGEKELISNGIRPPNSERNSYPLFAPIGAGMAVRREAIQSWLKHESTHSDRRGPELTSSGDNDIVLAIMEVGWEVAYIPELSLNHLIPAGRLDPNYLARLNRGIQKSWPQVLLAHGACPWATVPRWSIPLRKLKAWFTYSAWSSPAAHIRWQGACGHFEGRVAIQRP